MRHFLVQFLKDEDGPTAVEYAVLLALILVSVMSAIGAVGDQAGGMWGNNETQIINAGLGQTP